MKIILTILYLSSIIYSQEYPSWFLNKPNNENKYYCGTVVTEYDKDSSFISALKNAALKAAINKSTTYELADWFSGKISIPVGDISMDDNLSNSNLNLQFTILIFALSLVVVKNKKRMD